MLLLLTAFLELVMNPYDSEAGLLTYYKLASQHKNAGGLIGGCIVKLLCPLIGVVGTYVVIIIFADNLCDPDHGEIASCAAGAPQ